MEELLRQILETQNQMIKAQNQMIETQNQILKTLQQHGERLELLEKGQLRLETRMENDVIDKIRALSDGFELRGDQIENLKKHIDERLDSIEIDTGYLVSRVARLEKVAK